MNPIRLLSEAVVNRIAAGEVIERPAAAVRELVENALDAGATRIAVTIEGGGIDFIEVADDGVGMSAAELSLCVLRHATSKLVESPEGDELVRITTLGFRGEALPSIGAAGRLAIISRPAGSRQRHGDPRRGRRGERGDAGGGRDRHPGARCATCSSPPRRGASS